MKEKDDFLVLDKMDYEIFTSLMRKRSNDFFRLDVVDQKIFVWLLTRSSHRLKSWVEYLATDYHKRKYIKIDPAKLLQEVNELLG